jgi:hypothetical protein
MDQELYLFSEIAKRAPENVTKASIYQKLHEAAARQRGSLTQAQAFTKLILDRDGPGGQLYAIYCSKSGPGYVAKMSDTPTTNFSGGGVEPGMSSGDGENNSMRGRGARRQREDDVDEDGSMQSGSDLSLAQQVALHMGRNPNVSRGKATAAVVNTPKGKAAYDRERNARLTKALRL